MANERELYYEHRSRFNELIALGRRRRRRRRSSSTTSTAPATTASAGSIAAASSTCPLAATTTHQLHARLPAYAGAMQGWGFSRRLRGAGAEAGRLHLRRPAVRRRVHAVQQRGVRLGRSRCVWRSGLRGTPGRSCSRTRRRRGLGALPRLRVRAEARAGAAHDQLQRRPHQGDGSHRDEGALGVVARKDLPYAKRDTTTGAVMEAMVLPALERAATSTSVRSTSANGWAAASTSSTWWRITPRARATCCR